MTWCSIDPGKGKSGIAHWSGDELNSTATIRPRGAKGLFYMGSEILDSRRDAWIRAVSGHDAVIIEEGFGGRTNIVKAQGWMRGYIEAICDQLGSRLEVVNVSEWRRVIKEAHGVSWPRDSKRCKALSQKIVRDEYGALIPEDEADAVLLGVAAIRMGLVD